MTKQMIGTGLHAAEVRGTGLGDTGLGGAGPGPGGGARPPCSSARHRFAPRRLARSARRGLLAAVLGGVAGLTSGLVPGPVRDGMPGGPPLAGAAWAQSLPMRPVDRLQDYAQDAAVLSFMAAAVASLRECSGPIGWWERPRASVLLLEARCDPGEAGAETRRARMTFVIVRAGLDRPRLVPFRLEILP